MCGSITVGTVCVEIKFGHFSYELPFDTTPTKYQICISFGYLRDYAKTLRSLFSPLHCQKK